MAVLRLMEKRKKQMFFNLLFPDKTEREKKAVDLSFESATGKYVMEHTQIESFPEQILDDIRLIKMLGPLEKKLEDALPKPGHYQITIECGVLRSVKDAEKLRSALVEWISKEAPALKTSPPFERCVKKTPPGVPFAVLLCRQPGMDGKFLVSRYSPKGLEEKRRLRLDKPIKDKFPKLSEAKGRGTSILVLESDDIALANYDLVAEAVKEQFSAQELTPDEIYLVETEGEPWRATVLKQGYEWFPSVRDTGPHEIEVNAQDGCRL